MKKLSPENIEKRNKQILNAALTQIGNFGEINKTKIANSFGISPRTVGRVLDKFPNKIIEAYRKVSESRLDEKESESVDDIVIESFTGDKTGISLLLSNGETKSVSGDDEKYHELKSSLLNDDFETALSIVSKIYEVFSWSNGDFNISGNSLTYKGNPVNSEISRVILKCIERNDDFEHVVKFYQHLMNNHSYRSVNQLYSFIAHNDIKINDDGMIEAWKFIRRDWTDWRTGKISNRVGEEPFMLRNEVDDNPNETCSYGFHVCAAKYIKEFDRCGEVRFVKVLVNPADVVSVPTDYNGAKMRVFRYKVIKEVNRSEIK